MRILLDARSIDIWPYGVGRYAREMAARLPLAKPDWEWILLRYGNADAGLKGNVTTLWQAVDYDDYPRQQLMLDESIATAKPDLVHSFWFPAPENFDGPTVITVQDAISQKGHPEFMNEAGILQNYWQLRTCRGAAHIIAPSFYTLRDLASIYDYPADQVTVIPHAPSDAFFHVTQADIRVCRAKYRLPETYIYSSAHIPTSYKNTAIVPQALEILKRQGAPVPTLVSTGNRKPESREGWVQLPLLDDPELAAIMAGAELMVYPSKAEGFGFPPLEAMACGVPTITSNAASLPEIGGDAVVYFDPNSVHELAASIRALLNSPSTRQRLSVLGRQRATGFTWERTVSETLRVYERLRAPPRRSPRARIDWRQTDPGFPRRATARNPGQDLASLERQRQLNPRDPNILRELGKAYKALGRWTDARSVFEDMIGIAEEAHAGDHRRSALFHLGECCFRLGAFAEAQMSLRECLRICSTHQAAPLLLEQMEQMQSPLLKQ